MRCPWWCQQSRTACYCDHNLSDTHAVGTSLGEDKFDSRFIMPQMVIRLRSDPDYIRCLELAQQFRLDVTELEHLDIQVFNKRDFDFLNSLLKRLFISHCCLLYFDYWSLAIWMTGDLVCIITDNYAAWEIMTIANPTLLVPFSVT